MAALTRRIHVVLLQVRERTDVEEQEQRCFLERCRLNDGQLEPISLIREPNPPWERLAAADAVMIGGAGVHTATKDYDFTGPLTDTVLRMCEEGRPLFGSCWGHQFIAKALGGTLLTDAANSEVGTHEVQLTDRGSADPLFAGVSKQFNAQMGRHDYVSALPEGAVELAYSKRSRNQAFRLEGKPIYGTQFHSELSVDRLLERLAIYKNIYVPDDCDFGELQAQCRTTPEADQVLSRFLDLYVSS
ncbi:MAG: type 1 glutamine amidotransferase [bacterium]|nr:type 1 glutamine amidotransferase [bacterium]